MQNLFWRITRAVGVVFILCPWGNSPTALAQNSEGAGNALSHRLIVEFKEPPLCADPAVQAAWQLQPGPRSLQVPAARPALARIAARQDQFLAALPRAVPGARLAQCRDEAGQLRDLRYVVAFNGVAIDPGATAPDQAAARLRQAPGVKAVHRDYAHQPHLYASVPMIEATSLWVHADIGGQADAGRGIRAASMDGGVHHAAPMFSGAGYDFPAGFPPGGLGDTNNNNGKIIASRAYFRPWDPPAPGESNVWPGVSGTSHGVHTAGIMGGNPVLADYQGYYTNLCGVAPAAWIMSYRIFYYSVTGRGSMFTAEGLLAYDDIIRDGADVLNNSWGGGPAGYGEADPLEAAGMAAAQAGIFISFSAGNSGPYKGTMDHPDDSYITVASLTGPGNFSSGSLSATAPAGAPEVLSNIQFSAASFGPALPAGTVTTLAYHASALVDPANLLGCNPWPAGAFAGKVALIKRGTCDFSAKVLAAEQAGAELAVIYNHEAGGDALMTMGGGCCGEQVTIPSCFIGNTAGRALVNWLSNHPAAEVTFDMVARPIAQEPYIIADSSSRGPGMGEVLKPDVSAPGVNILSQGYTTGATGELRHLGFGLASGTSMASPHVAGAAALLRQVHPDWPNDYIKSALMTTARYLGICLDTNGTPAQPLDMGAGCIQLAQAPDPGLILFPPSLSFGVMYPDSQYSLEVTALNISTQAELYTLSTLSTTGGYQNLAPFDRLAVAPPSFSVAPGETVTFTATFAAAAADLGDYQGFLVISGQWHQAHQAAWARVSGVATAEVLLVDHDASQYGLTDYRAYYTAALDALGLTWEVLEADTANIPEAAALYDYMAIVYFSGTNIAYDLDATACNRLTEYMNYGGRMLAMGSYLDVTLSDAFLRETVLGIFTLQDTVTLGDQPQYPLQPLAGTPPAFTGLVLNVGADGDGAHNLADMAEWSLTPHITNDYVGFYPYQPLLHYPGPDNISSGLVAILHRAQPTLEWPGENYAGQSLAASFGLEGINTTNGYANRTQFLSTFWQWMADMPMIMMDLPGSSGRTYQISADLLDYIGNAYPVRWRWNFGDGTGADPVYTNVVTHTFPGYGEFTVRVEVVNNWGNHGVSELYVLTPPDAPAATDATARAASGFVAQWNPADGATNYLLFVALDGGFTQPVNGYHPCSAGTNFSLAVTGLVAGTRYYYRIQAVNEAGAGEFSATIEAWTTLDPPVGLPATNVTASGFCANWQPAAGATGYLLDVSPGPLFTNFLDGYAQLPVGLALTYPVTGVTWRVAHYYRLYAQNGYETSTNSAAIEVRYVGYTPWFLLLNEE